MDTLLAVFLIAALGYALGGIRIKGVGLGTAGVLLVALVFGHFGAKIPAEVRNIGLASFVTSVSLLAGPNFFRDFKQNAKSYILLGFIIKFTGALCAVLLIKAFGLAPELSVGLMAGALTSTPGLAAAQEAAGELAGLATTGYAIAYPFAVLGVVLFVQLVPKLLGVDIKAERERFEKAGQAQGKRYDGKLFNVDGAGFFAFTAAVVLGLLLGGVKLPLPGGGTFSLGTTGGPMIVGLLFGHFGHIGPVDISVPAPTLKTLRELGLMLFLIGAGVSGGAGFVATLQKEGFILFVYGAGITMVSMTVGYLVAAKVLKLSLFNSLGSVTGGMTSTPALGTLIQMAGTEDVASAYAATYPIALVSIVLAAQFVVILFR